MRNLLFFGSCMLLLGVLAGLAYFGYQGASTFLHPARRDRSSGDYPSQFGVEYRDTTLHTKDGVELSAWYTPSRNDAIILVAHGYGGIRSGALHAFFAQHGYGVISWDARAHGTSEGTTTTWGYYESLDAEAALDFALSQPDVMHIGALGQSMGAATVLKAAAYRPEIEAIVLDSAFPAIDEMIE